MSNPPEIQAALEWGMNRLATDQKTIAERKWRASIRAPKAQLPCDIGLFSDERDQLDLVEMFQDPTNGD
jgi:hypothetical protein